MTHFSQSAKIILEVEFLKKSWDFANVTTGLAEPIEMADIIPKEAFFDLIFLFSFAFENILYLIAFQRKKHTHISIASNNTEINKQLIKVS